MVSSTLRLLLAADYVAWRKGGTLYNEVANVGTNSPQDYTEWRTRFGNNTPGSGTGLVNTPVPEPATVALVLLTCLCLSAARHRHPRSPGFSP